LTPGLSFDHNLCYRCPNGSCEAILDIYTSRPFQRYKERLNARCFDPCNRALSFWESRRTPKSHFRECEWRPHTSLKVGLWHKTHWNMGYGMAHLHIVCPFHLHNISWGQSKVIHVYKINIGVELVWNCGPHAQSYTPLVSHKIMMDNVAMYNLANTPMCSCGINVINKVNITEKKLIHKFLIKLYTS